MASGGSSGRGGSGSRSFDFGSDDVLCSYDDLVNTEGPNGKRSEPSGKDLHESRPGRSSQSAYQQQEGYDRTDVIFAVEKCMKKYADNMLSFLEGISRRLSQLEVYCYNLEKSIGEFRSDLSQEQNEADMKFKSLEKHLQEVHRSIQILRDKQELAETQKELVKLQLGQKDSPDGLSNSASELRKKDDASDADNKQLALALPQVVAPQSTTQPREPNQPYNPAQLPTSSALNMQQPPYMVPGSSFYPQQNQLPNQPSQPPQSQHVPPPELRYVPQTPQQDHPLPPPQQQQQLPVSASQSQSLPFSQYQSQWPQQFPQPPQQSTPQASFSTQSAPVYPPPYQTSQPVKSSPETYQGSMAPPVGYSSVPSAGGNRQEPALYGYGGPANAMQQSLPPAPPRVQPQPQPQLQSGQGSSGPQLGKSSYMVSPPYPPQASGQGYGMYAPEGGRPSQSQTLYPGSYHPAGMPPPPPQNQQSSLGSLVPYQHSAQPPNRSGHPYGELMDKAVSMGYPRDQVVGAIYRMEESGQPVDFNSLLDLLNGSAGGGRRGWSS